ncbi:MAG: formate--tetrahydrofolate ligase, partial [Eubacterium sp.]|nr:formate--tetrahydrofolate ligase [Eubacterium sp.]
REPSLGPCFGIKGGAAGGGDERDVLFADAGRLCIQKDKGSTSMIQRQFRVGFNRAARIMDQLYDAGVVGQEETNKPRKVLMSLEEFEEMLSQ